MTTSNMFRVTPVPENRDRKVSFSPDIDESYRHQVVDKIQGLMKEVEVRHTPGFPANQKPTNFPTPQIRRLSPKTLSGNSPE